MAVWYNLLAKEIKYVISVLKKKKTFYHQMNHKYRANRGGDELDYTLLAADR